MIDATHQDAFETGGVKIAELARDLGTTPRALRHYEGLGLILPGRTAGGTRLYGPRTRRRVETIVGLRRLGLATDEISATLGGPQDDARDDTVLVQRLRSHLADLDARRAEILATLEAIA